MSDPTFGAQIGFGRRANRSPQRKRRDRAAAKAGRRANSVRMRSGK